MPIITVKVAPRSPVPDLERAVATLAARASTECLRKRADLTAVVVERVDPAAWFAGGPSLADQGRSSYWLEIRVVDGTNTKEEKEAFLAAIHDGMGRLLGDLHPESYVHVAEVSADAYGFGGLTQERRFIAGRLGVPPAAAA
ncbi:4-oxalocrotonate tautomerase [Methylobacterium sp. BE186]|uniref:tautomerase family protein n=1 Tax=Methylobacterium sp. BE186 TaxID=2817715 RepID=UPI00285A89A1|nr:tautomerase family protein [Methylobacterium sp. BE186]MDR7039023.1 4-oxalocrotonate tautomerase [Methylobacterium sp. BE186]